MAVVVSFRWLSLFLGVAVVVSLGVSVVVFLVLAVVVFLGVAVVVTWGGCCCLSWGGPHECKRSSAVCPYWLRGALAQKMYTAVIFIQTSDHHPAAGYVARVTKSVCV